jgi:hypothetical protein
MFPLAVKSLPENAAELRDALEESLRSAIRSSGSMVAVEDKNYPALTAIRISLDGAEVRAAAPTLQPTMPAGAIQPALTVENFEISGHPIRLQDATIDLSCRARTVEIGQGRDRNGNLLLLLQNAADGSVEIATSVKDLEALLRAGATAATAQQGVTIEDVQLKLRSQSERSLDVEVQVRAKKLFLSASVRIDGKIEIDDALEARISGLRCEGEGALSTMACGFLEPQLSQFNNRSFSLLALPLGDVKLHAIKIAATDRLTVSAEFGKARA